MGLGPSHLASTGLSVRKMSRVEKWADVFAVFFACFSFAFIVGSLVFVPRESKADSTPGENSAPTLSMSISPNTASLVIAPARGEAEGKTEITATVSTNNPVGYQLSMSAPVAGNYLYNPVDDAKIVSSENTVPAPLASNTWGYNVGTADLTENFLAIPVHSSADNIGGSSGVVEDDDTTVTIGAKINAAAPAGDYSNTLVFTAVGNDIPLPETTALDPNQGSVYGGDVVIFSGENMDLVTGVMIDGRACTELAIISTTSVSCVAPEGESIGEKDIVIQSYGRDIPFAETFLYYLPEEFRFSIDTRFDASGGLTGNETTFAIPTSGYVGGIASHNYTWNVDCDTGDDVGGKVISGASGITAETSNGIMCTYATPGKYQVAIRATTREATDGWMNAFGFYGTSTSGANVATNRNMIASLDSTMTQRMRTTTATRRFAYMFAGARNAAGIPDGFFDEVFVPSGAMNLTGMFLATFQDFAKHSVSASIPQGLFDSITNTAGVTSFSYMFSDTFSGFATASVQGVIPADLFGGINTAGARSSGLSYMFNQTFANYASGNSAEGAAGMIPVNLFSTITIPDTATNIAYMFKGVFKGFAKNSTSAFIPRGLFDNIVVTNKVTRLDGMFQETFADYASPSATATIPGDLFHTIDTTGATGQGLQHLFRSTFRAYAMGDSVNGAAGAIPSNLFATIIIPNTVNDTLQGMYAGTFESFAYYSTTATIPSGLFPAGSDTSNAKRFATHVTTDPNYYAYSGMFAATFKEFANNSTVGTIPGDLFSFMDVSSAVENGMQYVFNETFRNYARGNEADGAAGTVPAGLFSTITIPSTVTSLRRTYYGTFWGFACYSTTATIPVGLFSASSDTSNVTDFSQTFNSAFRTYASRSYLGTIPADLFSSFSTVSATSAERFLYETFSGYAPGDAVNGAAGSIPDGLFDTFVMPSSLGDASEMFYGTFMDFARRSTTAVIPNGLLANIDTRYVTNMNRMLARTFMGYAMYNRVGDGTPNADINDIWTDGAKSANLSNITAEMIGGGIYGGANTGVLNQTFQGVWALTGSAQTFIHDYLNDIVPTELASTFRSTGVVDLDDLAPNWK